MSLNTPKFGMLEGIKVVIAGNALAGPYAGCVMAENGAEVIHIEGSKAQDVKRSSDGGRKIGVGNEHRNLYEFGLDYVCPEGRKVFYRLIEKADVLIECNKGGTFEKWGMTDEKLWEINKKLVIVHISGYGQYGDPAYYKRASYDFIGQSFGGYVGVNGTTAGNNFAKPVACDYTTGMYGAILGSMALYKASKTGIGESIDVAQYEAVLRNQWFQVVAGLTDQEEPTAYDGCDPDIAGDATYLCKDGGRVNLFIAGTGMNQRAAKLMGFEDDEELKGVATVFYSDPYCEKYLNYIRSWCMTVTADEAEAKCCEYGIPCTKVMTYKDMLTNPQYIAHNSLVTFYSQWSGRELTAPAPVGRLKHYPNKVWRGGVSHGYDNEDILTEYGFSEEEIKALYDCGAVARLGKK